MKTDCIIYDECRLPVSVCNDKCKLYVSVAWIKGVPVKKVKKKMPQVQIGRFLICEQNNGKVWIENLDDESGEFDELLFEAWIEMFFNERV